jgi:6-phosphofructokinase 1
MPVDNVYCYLLGENAVHAAMSGKTEMVAGLVNNQYVHIPMRMIAQGRKQVDPKGSLWLSVLETTGQPAEMV